MFLETLAALLLQVAARFAHLPKDTLGPTAAGEQLPLGRATTPAMWPLMAVLVSGWAFCVYYLIKSSQNPCTEGCGSLNLHKETV